MTRVRYWIVLIALWAGCAGAVSYRGIDMVVSSDWASTGIIGTVRPIGYRLTNTGPAQKVTVFLESPPITVKRTHAMASGEIIHGFIYLPFRQRYMHGRLYFEGEKSGTLPQQNWLSFNYSGDFLDPSGTDVDIMLVGSSFDLTGLDAALSTRSGGRRSGPSSVAQSVIRGTAGQMPTSWIGLSGISMVLLEQEEAAQMSSDEKRALGDYVMSGGVVFLISGDAAWCRSWWGATPAVTEPGAPLEFDLGLGTVAQLRESPQGRDAWDALMTRLSSWPSRAGAGRDVMLTRGSARMSAWWLVLADMDELPLSSPDFRRISYTLMWWIMLGFAVVVGPVNYGWLKKRGKLAWFLVTVPVISLVSGGLLLLMYLVMEGREIKAVVSGVTFLSQPDRRALSFHRMSIYSPVSLELDYPADTIVAPRFGRGFADSSPFTTSGIHYRGHRVQEDSGVIDLTSGVTLGGRMVPPRLVRAFGSVHARTERGRVVFSRDDTGAWQARNGLGVVLTDLVYRDADGQLHHGERIANGATATLKPIDGMAPQTRHFDGVSPVPSQFALPHDAYIATTMENYGLPKPNARLGLRAEKHLIYGLCNHE